MSQRGKRGNNHRLECDPQPPPTKRRKGRPPNGSSAIGVAAGATGSKTTVTSSNTNDNDHHTDGAGCGNGGGGGSTGNSSANISTLSLPPPKPMASAASTSHTISSKIPPSSSTTSISSGGGGGVGGGSGGGASSSSVPWQARSVADIKISSIYNRSSTEAPAELYRKDLISAMKLPDSEPLASHEYLIVTDQWKQEWEKGVQVPVNPDSLPEPSVFIMQQPIVQPAHDFRLPKNRYIRITKDDSYSPESHYLTNVVTVAENTCAYDIDQVDEVWLNLLNKERALSGATPITSEQFERVIEELEIRCWEQIQVILKNEEGLGIEYDENVICDVCRSPDSEEANEMVFCDKCNICVHQACYGITAIPSGQWLCRTCSMNIKPACLLCPNKGGAMKSTKSGKNWAHVSCALWIPEVSIGCVDRMEPITKISSIPPSRWALICVLCKERVGACIQCSVKTCKTAYHVTCAFQHGLEMRAIIEEGNAEDGVKLRSYCLKHSMGSKGKKGNQKCTNNNGLCTGMDDDDCRRRKSRKDMTSEERNQVRAVRLQEVEAEFDKHVNIRDISCHLFECDDDAITSIYNYWKLKRKSRNNHALIPPKSEDVELIARKQEQADLENHKHFVHLRQDLERVRNLCYMVNRREKLSRSFFKLREQVFYKQIAVLSDDSLRSTVEYDENFTNAVIYANDGPALYDRFYTSSNYQGGDSCLSLEYIIEKLLGEGKINKSQNSSAVANNSGSGGGIGGLSTANRKKSISQYKKISVNGAKSTRRNGGGEHCANSSGTQSSSSSSSTTGGSSGSSASSSSSGSSGSSASSASSASENESTKKKPSTATKQRKKQSYSCSLEMRQKRRKASTAATLAASCSSDEEEKKHESRKRRNAYLSQMLEKAEGALSSSNESEEFIPLKNLDSTSKNLSRKSTTQIYSDSDSSLLTTEDDKDKNESNISDYQTNVRTKAAMKEFTLQQSIQKQKKEAAAAKAKEDVCSAKDKDRVKEKEKEKNKGKETTKENVRTESTPKDKKDDRSKRNKGQDGALSKSAEKQKFVTDLLVVPQRQAAKKASENMRSTNSYSSTAVPAAPNVINKKDSREDRESDRVQVSSSREKDKDKDREKDKDKDRDKDKDKEKDKDKDKDKDRDNEKEKEKEKDKPKESGNSCGSRLDEKPRSKEKDKEKEKPVERVVGKRGRPPKNPPKDEPNVTPAKDIVSPRRDKPIPKSESAKSITNKLTSESPNSIKPSTKNNILVAYVPQRQAAKKAAEQLKSGGMVKPSSSDVVSEEKESKEKEVKLKSPESNKKQTSTSSEPHTAKPRRLSKEITPKDTSLKETSIKETASTPRTTNTRRSKDSIADNKDVEAKVPVALAAEPALEAFTTEPTPETLAETSKSKEETTNRSSVHNLTSSSESSTSSSSSCSSSSSDESEVEESRKSANTRKLSKTSSGEKLQKKTSAVTQGQVVKSPTATLSKSPKRTKLPSISHSNNTDSINGTKGNSKKDETINPRLAEAYSILVEEKESEVAPIVLPDDDDDDNVLKEESSVEKEKAEDHTVTQTIEIDDDEVTKTSSSPNLEEEIAQRKADLVSTASLSNASKSHRNFGSLDKLLNKKERELSSNNSSIALDERKSNSSAAESTSNNESETFIEELKESQEDEEEQQEEVRIPTPSIEEKCSRSIRIEDPDIIELDSNSAQSLKIDSNEPQSQDDEQQDNSSEKPPQTPPLPLSNEESQKIIEQSPATPAAHHRHNLRTSSFDPTSEDQINLLDNTQDLDDNDGDDDDDDDATAAPTEFSFSQVLEPPDVDCTAQEPTADHESHKEDDSALTMNLVKKLRQSHSQKRNHSKCDDIPADFGPPPTPAIPTSFPYNHHTEDLFQQKENSAPTVQLKDTSTLQDDKVGIDSCSGPQLTNNNTSSLIVPFSENAINFLDKSSTHSSIVQFSSLQSANDQQQQPENILQDSAVINDTSSLFLGGMGDKKKTPQTSSTNNSECFNKLTDFKQPDFVDLHSTKEASLDFTTTAESASSKLVDCDYDENTRMQSPYMNAPNMWNENDLIQTRRSVSTSPSSVSESNDLPHQLTPCSKANQQPQHLQQDCNIKNQNHFAGTLDSFGGSLSSQFNSITQQQNNTSQNMVNGIDMINSPYNFAPQQQQQHQSNHSQNQYNGPVSLFHAPQPHANIPNHMNQIPFPTPGAVLFPSAGLAGNVPLSASRSHQQSSSIFGGNHQNHQQETPQPPSFLTTMSTGNGVGSGGAAFTSSSHNLALTAAIVSRPGANLDHHSPQNHQYNTSSAQFNPLLDLIPPISNTNKESPSKRTSARFSHQQQQQQQQPLPRKSPQMHKSPGKSPRQMELLSKQMGGKGCTNKFDGPTTGRQRKNSTRGVGSGRGRGRGRGRGGRLNSSSQIPPAIDYGNTHIVNNLVGTPYEFNYDEDMASSNVENLQSLRDRRRSFDCRGNLQQNTTPEQQKFSSPSYSCKMRSSTQTASSNNCNNRQGDLKTSTSNTLVNSSNDVLHNIVRPVLPGPVDMRTYNLDFDAQHSSASQEAYNNNLLGAFDSGTADQTLPDIDEEVEKEFQSVLKASGTGIRNTQNSQPANAPEVVMPAELQTSMETTSEEISIDSDTTNTKVSLSDSRNQLKLKIKGPLAYPDMYNSTNLTVQQSSVQVSVSQVSIGGGGSTVGGGGGGTSGIRRMRKKELLQYWGQKETNLDDQVGLPASAEKQAGSSDTMISRYVGIPKAVDSMLSIPTKDDYKGFNSTDNSSKRKKFASRELRQLDMSYDIAEGNPERRRSGCSTGSNLSVNNEASGKTSGKRRGRSKTLESEEEQAPKLKIKIRKKSYESTSTTASGGSTGNSGISGLTDMRVVSCPPKKRLTSNYVVPTFEMLRRESMNYRKKVMADFGDDDEEKPGVGAGKMEVQTHTVKKKSSKQKKEHKKKKNKAKHMQVIENNASDATTPKLIIRFGKRKVEEEEAGLGGDSITKITEANVPNVPIRLKLARNSEGGGYVIGNKQHRPEPSATQHDQSEENTAECYDRLLGDMPKETDSTKINRPVPPLKLRTNFHNEQSATDINTGYGNSSNSNCNSPPPSALPPPSPDTANTNVAVSLAEQLTDTSMVKSKTSAPATNDCSLLPLNKDCEVR